MKFSAPVVTVAAVCSVAALLTGCGSTAPTSSAGAKKEYTIGLAFDQMNETRQAELKALQDAAKAAGVKTVLQTANFDANTQASQIQTMVNNNKVDAIVAIPVDSQQFLASIAFASSQKVPVVAMDHPMTDTSTITYQITGDAKADGRLAGEAMKALKKPLKVIHEVGALTDNNAIGRRDGFEEAVKGSDVQVVTQVATDWNTTQALNGLRNALQSNPDANAIFLPSDFLLPSALSVLKSTGRLKPVGDPGHVTIVTIDGDSNGCAAIKDGSIDTNVVTLVSKFAPKSITAAVNAIEGKPNDPKVEEIAGLPISKANLAKNENEFWGCSAK
jgi:ABC-type sugar transport system substrate-binding protein